MPSLTLSMQCSAEQRYGAPPNCTGRLVELPLVQAAASPGLERVGGDSGWCHRWAREMSDGRAAQLLQDARREAGLQPLDADTLQRRQPFLQRFFAQEHGGLVWPTPRRRRRSRSCESDGAFVYVPIWKAASAVLSGAVEAAMGRAGDRLDATTVAQGPRFHFSFVREPLEHFLSGAAEAAWRRAPPNATRPPWSAEELLDALLEARLPRPELAGDVRALTAHAHYFPMSGVLPWWRLDFVGRLEAASADWAALRKEHCAAPRATAVWSSSWLGLPRTGEGAHDASSDTLGVRAELLALLRRRPALRRALCLLLSPDYRCFGFNQTDCLLGRVIGKPLAPRAQLAAAIAPTAAPTAALVLGLYAAAMGLACRADGARARGQGRPAGAQGAGPSRGARWRAPPRLMFLVLLVLLFAGVSQAVEYFVTLT